MNEHEEIAKALKARLSELRTHLAKVDRSLRKPLPADSEDQAIELENQEALEVIEKTETTEIHQIEAALNISGLARVDRFNAVYENSDSYRKFVNLERYGLNPTFYAPSAVTKIQSASLHNWFSETYALQSSCEPSHAPN